jgi:hypothetical protein
MAMKTMNLIFALGTALALGTFVAACGAELNPKTEGQIVSALEAQKGAFRSCYETALQKNRELQGNMALQLDIHKASGKVTKAQVTQSDIKNKKMKQCVAGAAGTIKLPEPPGVPVEGHYTLSFGFE